MNCHKSHCQNDFIDETPQFVWKKGPNLFDLPTVDRIRLHNV